MINSKKQMFIIIGVFALILMLTTITYAFFNYTRTGVANRIQVGRIYFNSEQTSINLTNVFPIDREELENSEYVGETTIHITGDTTYSEGIEYLVSVVDVNNTIGTGYNAKQIPISVDVGFSSSTNKTIGENDKHYFDNRAGNNSLYKVLAGNTIYEDAALAVGYIAKGETGIDGTITIKAFIDKDRIAISDTYPSSSLKYWYNTEASEEDIDACITYMTNNYSESLKSNETMDAFCRGTGELDYSTMESWAKYYFTEEDKMFLEEHHLISKYQNGTTYEWIDGRTVLTTSEWNDLQNTGVSFKVKVEANEGIWVSEQGNTMTAIPYEITNYRNNVKEIYFNDMDEQTMQTAYNAATIKADVTYNNEGKVLMWLEPDSIDNDKYIMYIASDGVTSLTVGDSLFAYYKNVQKIVFENINTSRVTSMSNMFRECYKLDNIDISMFDMGNVTNAMYMFKQCNSLNNFIFSRNQFSNLDNMYGMFQDCISFVNIDLSGMNTSRVLNLYGIFEGCNNLETINLSGWGGDALNNVNYMFNECYKLKNVDMSYFNFGVASMNSLFDSTSNPLIETITFENANTSKVSVMSSLFSGLSNLNSINLNGISTENVTSMQYFISGCSSLQSIDLSNLGGEKLSNVNSMFNECNNLEIINMSNFNFGTTTSLNQFFAGMTSVEIIDISNINISNTTSPAYNMFYNCPSLTTIYVSEDFDFSNQPDNMPIFGNNTSLVGGQGTAFDVNNPVDKTYAKIDGGESNPGYFTLKTN